MKKHKQIILQLPEYYLIVLALLAGYTPPYSINPFAIGIVIILALQIIYKNKIAGHLIASLFLIGNLVMLLAFTAELNEFPRFNAHAKELLFGGLLLLGFNIIVSGLMIVKYTIKGQLPQLQTESGLQEF